MEEFAGLWRDDVHLPEPLDSVDPDGLETFEKWTAGLLRDTIGACADQSGLESEELLEAVVEKYRGFVRSEEEAADRAVARLDRIRHQRLLPDPDTLNTWIRYGAHLNRQFYRALHELEALQVRRRGGVAPLARVDVQGLLGE